MMLCARVCLISTHFLNNADQLNQSVHANSQEQQEAYGALSSRLPERLIQTPSSGWRLTGNPVIADQTQLSRAPPYS